MEPPDLRKRIAAQYSYHGRGADIWRGFDLVLETDSFLNLGYSSWYQSHLVGSSQRRLAVKVGDLLASHLRTTEGRPLLDVGCGRGGPAIEFSNRFGFDVTGVDLVPYNVTHATHVAQTSEATARFVVGDATALPFTTETMAACTAIDALVYVPDRMRAISELSDVLATDGVLVISDLLTRAEIGQDARDAVTTFADAWDMPPLGTVDEYRQMILDAGLSLLAVEKITKHSVGRFRKWTTLFLGLFMSPVQPIVVRLLRRYGLDPRTIHTQVRAAHNALPYLEHVIYVANGYECAAVTGR